MKFRDLVKQLKELGWHYLRSGGNHDIYQKGSRTMPIPRHTEINEITAREIVKKARR